MQLNRKVHFCPWIMVKFLRCKIHDFAGMLFFSNDLILDKNELFAWTGWCSAKTLKNHIAQQHGQIVTICDIGGCVLHSFIDAGILEHKRRVHEKTKPFSCDFCERTFGSKLTLKSHIGNIHQKDQRKFHCDFCSFTCLAASRLKVHHHAVHVQKIKYQCSQCPFNSFRKTGLQNHVKVVHEKYYPHECGLCKMSFAYKREKIKHMEKNHDSNII